jgi:hypothetical protein
VFSVRCLVKIHNRGERVTILQTYLIINISALPFTCPNWPPPPSSSIHVSTTWSTAHPWNASFHLSFLILQSRYDSLDEGISRSQDRYLTQTESNHKQTSMTWVEFEPTIPVFERAKPFQAVDRAATVIVNCPYHENGSHTMAFPSKRIYRNSTVMYRHTR